MADTGQQELELLFFDTFSHENTEELNLDLVQFPRPVIIHEVRVIPLKTRVQADVPGGVRLGATNPSSFSLELFVNNLNKPNASTFEKLGMLNYKENVDIQMKADGEIPTDGLILKGWYNTLTVAIYGTLTVVKPEHPSPPPPPPPQRAKQAVEAVRNTNPAEQTRAEWEPPRQPAKPQQQHPLDYINQQVQLQQQQQQAAQAAHTLIPPPHTIGHPSPQSGVPPPQGPTQGVPPAKQSEVFPEQYDRPHHAGQSQHRDILQDFISSPKMGHMEQRDGHFDPRVDPRQSPNVGRDGQFPSESREQFEFEDFRGHRESGGRDSDFDRSRENSRDRDFREKEREVRKKEWERFRERERERSREKEREYGDRDWPRSPARRKSYSRSPSNSRSRSRSRSRSYSRSHSRSPRRSARSSRSPRRSFSRSPRRSRSRSRSSIRSRSRTPIRSRSRSPMRSYSRSPERRSPAPAPGSPLQTPLSPSRSRSHSRDMESPIHQIPTITRRQPDSSPPYMREPSPTPEEIMEAGEIIDEIGEDALFDPLSPDGMNYSDDGEVQDIGDTYENISSDDELPVMEEIDHFQDYEDIDESWTFPTPTFNPFNTEFVPLLTFTDNSYTSYELEKMLIQQDTDKTMETPAEAKSLLGIIEEFTASDHHDKWISALEEAPKLLPKGLSYLLLRENRTDVLDTLIDWVVEGLDEKKAILQPENAFKIRHLKMGIKLAGSMGCCDSDVMVKLVEKNIQHKLLDLYCSPCMSFSLKLQIVQALDHTTRIRDGFEWLMGIHPMQKVIKSEVKTEVMPEIKQEVMEDPTGYTESCYTKLLEIMLKKQNVRVTVALTALLKKIHTFQILAKLSYQVDSIIESTPSLDEKTGDSGTKVQEDADAMETDIEGMLGNQVVNETEMESIISNLAEIAKVFTIADQIIGQPKRTLPGKRMFDIKGAQYNPYPVLYHISHTHHLLEGVFYLLSSPATSSHPLLFAAVRDFLQTLIKTQSGLLFLFSKPETSNGIIRCLIQLADDGRDEAVDENPMQQLGLDLVYHLQTLQHVDQLLARQKENKDLDNPQVISILHSLYTMTFTPQGRQAVINVLCMENNLEVLLSIVDKTGDEEQDTKRKKSVCVAYSMGLLLILLRHSTNVLIFEKFGPRLVTLSDEDFSSKLLEMQEWLSPIRSMTCYTYNSVSTAVQQLKQHAEDLQKIPRGLITTMRILRHMTIPPERKYPEETSDALKYRYAVLEMYSADSLSVLMNILQKVSEILLRPWQRGIPQSSEQISYHLAVVKPTLEIVKYTLGYIIMARGTEFRDLTALPVLFELNTVLCSVPLSSSHLLELQEIQRNIMDALMTYTQPIPSQSDSDESLSQSLWTKIMKELLKYTTKAPYTYLSGLLLLSELLPLPLPIQTKEPLSDAEVQLAVNCRKLWSVHLHSLTSDIQEMIQILATSTCQPLQQVLRRVCWQLSDLSAPMAVVITKCILDLVVNSFQTLRKTAERKEEGENVDETIGRIASPYASKMLNLLAFVLSQPSIKCAALQLMTNAGDPAIEKYGEMLPHMLEILNSVCQSVPHVQAQECIVSILQSICDPEVALVIGDTVPINDQIAYSLPNSDYMTRITTALLDHMGSPDHSYASILPCVRTLVMLTEHDYGFYHLKTVLEQKTTAIGRLMVRINTTFSKDSSDCLSTLSTLLEFLRLLMTVEGATEDGITVTRTCSLSQQDLQKVLSWNPSMENHPLLDLEKLLEDCAKDEETLESLLESMTSLMKMLREKDKESQEKPVLGKPELPLTENLSNLYNLRTVFVVTDMEDERLNPDYWLSNPATDVADIEPELIMFNMEDMCHKYCPEFNLEEELKKTVATSQAELTKPRRIRTGDRRKSQEISINRGRGLKRPFVAPMRGRGIARGMMGAGGRMDSFRTRTPNTSRPPSMHVDDFMKLEKGQTDQENRNAGVPVSPIRRVDSVIQRDNRGRGRGFDRGRGGFNRGRFFTPPGNYGPRESNNIYVGGGGVGGSGGGRGNYNNRPKPNYESPHSFARGNYAGSGDRRGGRDYRYSPRGRGNFFNKDKDPSGRFMGGGFRGRRDTQDRGRHVRSFTK